ncbi:tRNA (5-methylaminomethyl-2-thiouridine)(34)-methyltransferase MnmD [Kangiella sediminilitoris]|uniref:tRNA 5-methylaminomethyl-2-thiouridine biosynthesis bifunctional protein MnmC n=1 Tax=Kangiella sediminilitoris TaxID=1144748 RepID=A0A1B3B9R2_9GAMM|nr:tRNA (5-methylaminomethyl-2-thiouridine)(34)-methyltransferase MnmD [Kangiella sediminilitoris]AOE49551.1 tRNA 5-methylaminomethyl-2-thiouridine biosynthesis bifunctional protein MnmC [Kangiella sediminilitoris]
MHNAFLGVKPAVIEWRRFNPEKHQWLIAERRHIDEANQQLAPYSPDFDDIYFNPENGIAESEHVFLQGNDLEQRFNDVHQDTNKKSFNIFETGFGTGLNFLLTAQLWQSTQNKPSNSELHFWSVEQFPISPDDLRTIYRVLGLESELTQSLIEQYPDALPGVHAIPVAPGITLHLVLLPLDKALREIAVPESFAFDAWFLDGFAPSKNPEMWAKGLLHFMALNSKKGSTLATFTVAAVLRKPLPHYGFRIQKRPGFGRKREMLTATFDDKELSPPKPTLADDYVIKHSKANKVAVIGAGLAGCATAYQLLQQGIEVHLFDKEATIGASATNMPSLVALPIMSIDHNAYSQLAFTGFEHLRSFIRQYPGLAKNHFAHQLSNKKYSQFHLEQYETTYSAQTWASSMYKFEPIAIGQTGVEGLKIPAIQVNGPEFCQVLIKELAEDNIHLNNKIQNPEQLDGFDHVIICSGYQLPKISLSQQLPQISPMRGQLTTLKTKLSHQTPVNHDGHLTHFDNKLVIGATFERSSDDTIRREDSLRNIEKVNKRFGLGIKEKDIATEHPGIRATSYDRFPFCGYLTRNQKQSIWVNYGYGARGLCFALLCGEVITNAILGNPSPLTKTLLSRITPRRTF